MVVPYSTWLLLDLLVVQAMTAEEVVMELAATLEELNGAVVVKVKLPETCDAATESLERIR